MQSVVRWELAAASVLNLGCAATVCPALHSLELECGFISCCFRTGSCSANCRKGGNLHLHVEIKGVDALDFYMEMEIATFPTIGGARASTKAAANETTLQLQ